MNFSHNKNMKKRKLQKNLVLLFPTMMLVILSLLNMYGASFISEAYTNSLSKQILWTIISSFIAIILYKMDIRFFTKNIRLFYLGGLLLLVLVLIIGSNINGASSWFRIGPFSFQPSEIFKYFLLIFLSLEINK